MQVMQRTPARRQPPAPDVRVLPSRSRAGAGGIDEDAIESRLGDAWEVATVVMDHGHRPRAMPLDIGHQHVDPGVHDLVSKHQAAVPEMLGNLGRLGARGGAHVEDDVTRPRSERQHRQHRGNLLTGQTTGLVQCVQDLLDLAVCGAAHEWQLPRTPGLAEPSDSLRANSLEPTLGPVPVSSERIDTDSLRQPIEGTPQPDFRVLPPIGDRPQQDTVTSHLTPRNIALTHVPRVTAVEINCAIPPRHSTNCIFTICNRAAP